VPLLGELGPHLTLCRLVRGLPPYQVAYWFIQPFGHNGYGPKIGDLCPYWGELVPHLTQCGFRAKWHLDPSSRLTTTDMGQELRYGSAFCVGTGFSYKLMWPGARPTSIPSGVLIRRTIWPQYTNVTDRQTGQDRQRSDNIGRTVLQTLAQK